MTIVEDSAPPAGDSTPRPGVRWRMTPLDRTCWRIHDTSRAVDDAECLVAYVERNDLGMYDVLWLRSPCPTRSRYRTLDQLRHELDEATQWGTGRQPRSQAPNPVPSLPPR